MSVDQTCQDWESEISGILLIVDLRVMGILEFDVILRMDRLMAHRVLIDGEHRRVIAYTQDDTRVTFQGDKHNVFS